MFARVPLTVLKLEATSLAANIRISIIRVQSTTISDGGLMRVFDRKTKLLQRERAARDTDAKIYDYLKEEVGYRLSERIFDIKRDFKVGLDLGCGRGCLARHLTDATVEHLYMSDLSPAMVELAENPADGVRITKKVIDEEEPLPFDDNSFDLVLSNLSLHWVNNLPGCLREIRRVLRDDGVFLASMFGGETLFQLRSSLVLAELEREGGFSSHVSPFAEIQDISGLLSQAGFTLLTIDIDEINVGYPSMFELMRDLQGMAENNAGVNRKLCLHRDTVLAAAAMYQEMYGKEDGISATFQIIYMIGWKPDPKKPIKLAERGSGQMSLKEISDLNKLNEMVKNSGMEGRVQFMKELETLGNEKDDENK